MNVDLRSMFENWRKWRLRGADVLHSCLYQVFPCPSIDLKPVHMYNAVTSTRVQPDPSKLFCFFEMPSLHLLISCRSSIRPLQVPLFTMKTSRVLLVPTTTASATPGALLVAMHLLHFESDCILDFLSVMKIFSR